MKTSNYVPSFSFLKIACLFSVAVLTLAGCATQKGKVQVQREPSFEGKVQRALVVCPDERTIKALGKNFSERFLKQFTNSLALKNIPTESVTLDKDALDNSGVIDGAVRTFRPGQVIRFALTDLNTSMGYSRNSPQDLPQYRSQTSAALQFNVFDIWANQIVWRARFSYGSPPQPETVADQLIEELEKARLF